MEGPRPCVYIVVQRRIYVKESRGRDTPERSRWRHRRNFQKIGHQPRVVVFPALGLWSAIHGKRFFPVSVRARNFGVANQVRSSHPASARSVCTPRLNPWYDVLKLTTLRLKYFFCDTVTGKGIMNTLTRTRALRLVCVQ